MKKIKIEVCTDNLISANIADKVWIDRIELCQALSEGGLTPSYALIKYCCDNLKPEVAVLVRPRGGDFIYSDEEYELIKKDVLFCREMVADAVVVGFLDSKNNVDKVRLKQVVTMAGDMEVVFHRAFDRCANWEEALEDIIECGCTRILTSAQHDTAYEGRFLMKEIIKKADGRITIMPGSGINSNNIKELHSVTGFRAVHFSAKIMSESGHYVSSEQEIVKMKRICANLCDVVPPYPKDLL